MTHSPQWRGLRPVRLLERFAAVPETGNALEGLGRALMSELDGRTYETIALRVSVVRDCLYVWRGHCLIALEHPTAPLTVGEIVKIAIGPSALTGRDAALVAAVDALLDRRGPERAPADLPLPVIAATAFYDLLTAHLGDCPPEPDAAPVPGLETPSVAAHGLLW